MMPHSVEGGMSPGIHSGVNSPTLPIFWAVDGPSHWHKSDKPPERGSQNVKRTIPHPAVNDGANTATRKRL